MDSAARAREALADEVGVLWRDGCGRGRAAAKDPCADRAALNMKEFKLAIEKCGAAISEEPTVPSWFRSRRQQHPGRLIVA
jgi:hypothetical protein